MNAKQVWTSPNSGDGWKVHKPGDKRDIAHFETKKEAVQKAREVAQNQGLELKIQNKDGKIS